MSELSGKMYVFEGTQDERELERLRALECVFDSATQRWLLATGLCQGWNCLEVGAGAGSVAKWMRDRVGNTGRVVALDLTARFLSALTAEGIEVIEAEVQTAVIKPAAFDLVHARFVLIHVPDWLNAFDAMIKTLKPGGWMLLEEPDFSSARSFAGPHELRRAFENVNRSIQAMFSQRGMDYAFGARIPSLLQEHGFEQISIENEAPIERGGSPIAMMMSLSTRQLRDKYIATDLASEEDIELYGEFADDPTCWAVYHGTIRGTGRKPRS